MVTIQYNIRIVNEKFGTLLDQTFLDVGQFKLFLKMIHASLELKTDLSFFNGIDFIVHIPTKHLVESLILTNNPKISASEVMITKSKIEAEHIK